MNSMMTLPALEGVPLAQNKRVPLTYGVGGEVVGEVSLEEGGIMVGEITNVELATKLFGGVGGVSLVTREDLKRD